MSLPYDDINTACREYIIPEMRNNIFESNVLAWRLLKNPKKWKGGTYFEVPVQVAKNTNAMFYEAGGTLTKSHTAEFTKARWAPAMANAAINLYGIELSENKYSGTKVFDLVKEKVAAAEDALKDKFCQSLISGTGSTDIIGFTGISGLTTGSSYAGISPSDATKWKVSGITAGRAGWRDATLSTLGPQAFAKLYMACSIDADQPTDIVTTQDIWAGIYGKVIEVNHRYSDEKMAQLGFTNVKYNNATISWSTYLAAKHMYAFSTKHLYFAVFPDMNFKFIPFRESETADVVKADVRWYGNLVCDARWSFGMQTKVATITVTS